MTRQETIRQDIKKLQQNKQFLTILVLLFVILLFWITISLISSQTTEKISPELQKLSKALTPVIDTEIFEQINQKHQYSEQELSAFTIFKVLLSRDGQTERVVPLEVTIDDLEPKNTPAPTTGSGSSRLQEQVTPSNQSLPTQSTRNTGSVTVPVTIPGAI